MAIDYEDAFGYPLRGDGALKRFLVGGGVPSLLTVAVFALIVLSIFLAPVAILILLLAPVWLAVALLLAGYYVRVVRATYDGNEDPPAFGDWQELLVDGGYSVLIGLGYALPLVLLGIVVTVGFVALVGGGAAMGGSDAESAVAALGLLSLLVFSLLSLVVMAYSLAVSYLYPISVCVYADTGDVRSSFSTERLLPVAKSSDYAIAWLVQAGVLFGIQTFVGMLTVILLGYLLYPFLPFATFFVTVAAFYMFAKAYQNEAGLAEAGDAAGDGPPVRDDSQPGTETGY
ncbi:DUF4013 domain-containing protein [Halobacteria archaeon HArc-gm2]|nr:DUF4013 domain-containing protein [Halobacteria archaeon HArc-gm2]